MVVTFLLMLIVGMLVAIFRSEFEAWMPWIAERLRRAALKRLPSTLRERLDEEWASYLDETPGYVGKVWQALGFNFAARRISISQIMSTLKGTVASKALSVVLNTGYMMTWVGRFMLIRSDNHAYSRRIAIKIAFMGIVIAVKSERIARFRASCISDDEVRLSYLSSIELAYINMRTKIANQMDVGKI